MVPILEDVLKWDSGRIRFFFESHGFAMSEWSKTRTDTVTLCPVLVDAVATQ
jgi:hypothetical protein